MLKAQIKDHWLVSVGKIRSIKQPVIEIQLFSCCARNSCNISRFADLNKKTREAKKG